MSNSVKIPDIGADSAEVIEILVSVGDTIEAEQSLVTLESDKASVEVPAPAAGVVKAIHVKVGDSVSEGGALIDLDSAESAESVESAGSSEAAPRKEPPAESSKPAPAKPAPQSGSGGESVVDYPVPDIGSDEAEVIEISVAVGDQVSEGETLVVAESDKASLEIPAEADGVVESIAVKVGSKISQGVPLVSLRIATGRDAATDAGIAETKSAPESSSEQKPAPKAAAESEERLFRVPDIGSDSAEVIEVPVAEGDQVAEGDTLVVAESDKASLEIPAEADGTILTLHVKTGDKIAAGGDLVTMRVKGAVDAPSEAPAAVPAEDKSSAPEPAPAKPAVAATAPVAKPPAAGGAVHAGPAVRKLARELGVELSRVSGSGPRGRITKDDLHAFVKQQLQSGGGAATGGGALPVIPPVDWSQYGSVRVEPMSRIHKVTAANMVRNWLNVPHVTQFDDADVTELEEYRAMLKHEGAARGVKMTPLAFLLKASAKSLRENPKFNSSLHENGNDLVYRDYFHIGVAVDTPKGLMVPVIRDVDQKDIWQLAAEVAELAGKARDGKLKPAEMQGACFTISSLGPSGGTGFTPIVNAPQVGILGVSKTSVQPVWNGSEFVPRKMLPLALSYDHRVINGADAGAFMTYLVAQLTAVENMW